MKHKFFRSIVPFLFPILAFLGCKSNHREPIQDQVLHEIIVTTSLDLAKEFNVSFIGFGGRLNGPNKFIDIGFQFEKEISLEDARYMLVHSAELLLERINSNETLIPYLRDDPFPISEIAVKFYCFNQNRTEEQSQQSEITVFRLSNGKLIYYTDDKEEILRTIYQESYEEALEKLKQCSLNLAGMSFLIRGEIHTENKDDSHRYEVHFIYINIALDHVHLCPRNASA